MYTDINIRVNWNISLVMLFQGAVKTNPGHVFWKNVLKSRSGLGYKKISRTLSPLWSTVIKKKSIWPLMKAERFWSLIPVSVCGVTCSPSASFRLLGRIQAFKTKPKLIITYFVLKKSREEAEGKASEVQIKSLKNLCSVVEHTGALESFNFHVNLQQGCQIWKTETTAKLKLFQLQA